MEVHLIWVDKHARLDTDALATTVERGCRFFYWVEDTRSDEECLLCTDTQLVEEGVQTAFDQACSDAGG